MIVCGLICVGGFLATWQVQPVTYPARCVTYLSLWVPATSCTQRGALVDWRMQCKVQSADGAYCYARLKNWSRKAEHLTGGRAVLMPRNCVYSCGTSMG